MYKDGRASRWIRFLISNSIQDNHQHSPSAPSLNFKASQLQSTTTAKMKVAFATTALLAGLVAAAPSQQVQARDEKAIERRLGPFGLAVAGGVVSGVIGAAAKKFLDAFGKKRAVQTFQEVCHSRHQTSKVEIWDDMLIQDLQFESGFALNVANAISVSANDDEASVCIKTGNYTLDDDMKTRGLATIELTSSDNDVTE